VLWVELLAACCAVAFHTPQCVSGTAGARRWTYTSTLCAVLKGGPDRPPLPWVVSVRHHQIFQGIPVLLSTERARVGSCSLRNELRGELARLSGAQRSWYHQS
jgi:hypothetical protein